MAASRDVNGGKHRQLSNISGSGSISGIAANDGKHSYGYNARTRLLPAYRLFRRA